MEQTKFYYITKEQVVNLLDLPSTFSKETITLQYPYVLGDIILSDFLISENILATPVLTQYVGKLGTKLVISANDHWLKEINARVNRVLKQYEL